MAFQPSSSREYGGDRTENELRLFWWVGRNPTNLLALGINSAGTYHLALGIKSKNLETVSTNEFLLTVLTAHKRNRSDFVQELSWLLLSNRLISGSNTLTLSQALYDTDRLILQRITAHNSSDYSPGPPLLAVGCTGSLKSRPISCSLAETAATMRVVLMIRLCSGHAQASSPLPQIKAAAAHVRD